VKTLILKKIDIKNEKKKVEEKKVETVKIEVPVVIATPSNSTNKLTLIQNITKPAEKPKVEVQNKTIESKVDSSK
jgi:hypothetical protein